MNSEVERRTHFQTAMIQLLANRNEQDKKILYEQQQKVNQLLLAIMCMPGIVICVAVVAYFIAKALME